MKSYKKQYKDLLIIYFNDNKIFFNDDIIKSIMNKVSIHSRNKYGCVSFEDEFFECGISNGLCFYDEYKKEKTFNRTIFKK
jgi:hypothetical protein